jgi:hypothetical protein
MDLTICKFFKKTGIVQYKSFYIGDNCNMNHIDESEPYYQYHPSDIYIHGNDIFIKINNSNLTFYNQWKQTKSGDWDWFKVDTYPSLVNIDNYLSSKNLNISFDDFINNILSYIDEHNTIYSEGVINEIKLKINDIFNLYKFEINIKNRINYE